MKTVKLLVLAAVLAASPACKKKDKPEAKPDPAGSAAVDPGSAAAVPTPDPTAGSAAAPTPTEDTADWIKVYASHFTKSEADPVEVTFEKFKVVKADFDPAKIEGGSATLEIDLAS